MKNVFKVKAIRNIAGTIAFVIAAIALNALSLTSCGGADGGGGGGNHIPWEDKPVKDRWGKYIEPDSTATLEYSVADDGVCTITVGGIAQPNNETDNWGRWKAHADYFYTAKAGKIYTYTFEARTESGTRKLSFQYLTDNNDKIYKSREILLTDELQTYTVYGGLLSKGAADCVQLQCADQLGTFYVKMLEIKEYIFTPGNETFTNIDEMEAWLDNKPDNTAATAYTIKLNVSDLGGDTETLGSVGYVLKRTTKYINLDLSGSTITSIGDYALDRTALTSITIPDSVTSIGGCAFQLCESLTSITIPDSVTDIGSLAFQYCTILTNVTIPASVTDIDGGVFAGCASLTAINVDSGNTEYCSDQGILYDKDKTTLIQYPAGKTDNSFVIPNSVIDIWRNAFEFCKLTSITIGSGVSSIYAWAFGSCTRLTSVTFQGTIAADYFGDVYVDEDGDVFIYSPFDGDLRDKFYAEDEDNGTPGTYTRPSGSSTTWTKQP